MTSLLLAAVLLAQPPATLASLGFIAGHWRGDLRGSLIEEVWTKPSGDAMTGMFRMVSASKTRFTEFMAIEQRATGPVLVLRHFHPGLIAWEDKDAPLVFPLETLSPDRAVFYLESAGTRLTYHRHAPTSLTITLEKTKEGKTSRSEFSFTLAAPAP